MSGHCFWHSGLLSASALLFAASLGAQGVPSTQAQDSIANYSILQTWCAAILKAHKPETGSQHDPWPHEVFDFCNLGPDDNLSPTEWGKWLVSPPPASAILAAYQKAVAINDSALTTASALLPFNQVTRSVQDPGTTAKPSFDQSTILWGITDFVVGRARENFNEYALGRLLDRICMDSVVSGPPKPKDNSAKSKSDSGKSKESQKALTAKAIAPYLEATCSTLLNFKQGGPLPSLASLRDAAKSDLETGPRTFLRLRALNDTAANRDRAVTAFGLISSVYALRSGKKLLPAIADVYHSIDPGRFGVSCAKTPIAFVAFELAAVAAQLAAGPPLSDDYAERQNQYGFALKAILHNLEYTGLRWPDCAGAEKLRRFQHLREIYGVVLTLDRALSTIKDLGDSPQGDPVDTAPVVRALAVLDGLFSVADAVVRIPAAANDTLPALLSSVHQSANALVRRQFGTAIYWAANAGLQLGSIETTALDKARPYLLLMVDVAQAETADAVASALERAAAPRHSFMRKRQDKGKFYASVNAYLGGAFGWERVQDQSLDVSRRSSRFVAPWLPIGVEAGFSLKKNVLSIGFMAQALDLGALGSYRLKEDSSVDRAPEISVRQVFSPALNVMLGVGNFPLSVGIQLFGYSPRLRRIETGGEVKQRAVTRRFGVTLALDVPIF